jgi:tripartite-type tricarboxylate transporter receptor subunit TctC
MTGEMRQPFVIDNRGGDRGTIGVDSVAKATPYGYTLLLHTIGHVTAPELHRKPPCDAEKDFAPIATAKTKQLILVVDPSMPVKTA